MINLLRVRHRCHLLVQMLWTLCLGSPLMGSTWVTPSVFAESGDNSNNILAPENTASDPSHMAAAVAPEPVAQEKWNAHGQFTLVGQFNPDFHAPYRGQNSFAKGNQARETIDLTLFLGGHLWEGGEFYADGELDQGFGIGNTLGIAGYVSGEAYRVGKTLPYLRMPRAFLRQTFALGNATESVESAANQLAGPQPVDKVTFTIGKFSVADIFDTNKYAHDPRGDFLNWSVIDSGAFDYAADAWGYSFGAAAEWTQSWWTLRAGAFNLSTLPNSKRLERHFDQYALISEVEERHAWFGHPGKLELLGFVNQGRMGDYMEAVRLAQATGNPADATLVRRDSSRPGIALNLEQEISAGIGAFARLSYNDGSKEAFDFTDINKSILMGVSFDGLRWGRASDKAGIAQVFNGLSRQAQHYFAVGGLGLLIGDGQLPHYAMEKITEIFYSMQLVSHLLVTADYQFVDAPAYNSDRGPVSVLGLRIHAEF